MKHFLRKRWAWGCFTIIIVLGLISPLVTHASFWEFLTPTGLVTGIFKITAYLFNFLFGLLFMLAAWLVDVMMSLNGKVLDPNQNTIVGVGWPIARDIANLGLVIVMIIIAVATIVRYREYGAKQLLPKLIAAAIIVNFSLTIMALFVNFSNTVTKFFTDQGTAASGGYSMTGALADAFGPQKFLIDDQNPSPTDPEEEIGTFTTLTTGVLSSLAGLFFTVLFTLLAAFVFLAFAFLLLLRFLYLTFLAILSPLVWLFWVFPPLRSQYSKWWSKFISWTFFAPAASFFMYLALASVKGLAEKSLLGNSPGNYFGAGAIGGIMQQGVQMIIVAGVMVGGLLVAEKMGITGASAMANIARGAGNGLRKYAGARTMQGLKGISETKSAQAIAGVAGKAGVRLQKIGGGFKVQEKDELDENGNVVRKKDSGLSRFGKRVANVATLGLRAPTSLYGDSLVGTEKGIKSLASREKIKAGSLMGQMLSGAGEKAGFSSKKAEGAKEPMKQSEKERELGELSAMESKGIINATDLNSRRTKIYNEMDYSDTALIQREIANVTNERKNVATALAANPDKDNAEALRQKAKYLQSQQETLVGKVQDETTARAVLGRLHGERSQTYGPDVLDGRVLDNHISRLQNQIKSSAGAADELQLLHMDKRSGNFTDEKTLNTQIRGLEGKLEGQKAIEDELTLIEQERTDPNVDQVELNRQTASLQKEITPQNSALVSQQLVAMDKIMTDLMTQIGTATSASMKEKLTEALGGASALRGQLQNKIRESAMAKDELARIHTSTAYTDEKERDAQLRAIESKLEGQGDIKIGVEQAIAEKEARRKVIASTPTTDTTALMRLQSEDSATDRRIDKLMDLLGKEAGNAEDSTTAQKNQKELKDMRDSFIRSKVDSSSLGAIDDEITKWDSRIKKLQENEKKQYGAEKIVEDRLEPLNRLRSQYVRNNDTPNIVKIDTEITSANNTLEQLREFRGKKPGGAAEWGARKNALDSVIKKLIGAGLAKDINDAKIADLKNAYEAAEDKFNELSSKKTASPKPPAPTPPAPTPPAPTPPAPTPPASGPNIPPPSF